jgi:Ser/Thr protein kinase RdoA (MazF antagonist)
MVYTALINNLAVACTYAMMNHPDPLQAATLVVQGYHKAYALTEQEVDLLYYLIAARTLHKRNTICMECFYRNE